MISNLFEYSADLTGEIPQRNSCEDNDRKSTDIDQLLIDAVTNDDIEAAKNEIASGASPNATDQKKYRGQYALSLAIEKDNVEMVRLLLEAGANPELSSHIVNPLGLSINRRNKEIFDLLLKFGSDPNAKNGECLMLARCSREQHFIQALEINQ